MCANTFDGSIYTVILFVVCFTGSFYNPMNFELTVTVYGRALRASDGAGEGCGGTREQQWARGGTCECPERDAHAWEVTASVLEAICFAGTDDAPTC